MPTAMFSSTPLDCTACLETAGNCKFLQNKTGFDYNPIANGSKNPHGLWWVKKYCTMTAVHAVTLYFPYILLLIPLIMVAIDKGFTGLVSIISFFIQIKSNDEFKLSFIFKSLINETFHATLGYLRLT